MDIVKENIQLKKKLELYEISTKLDYLKIEKLKEEIERLNKLIALQIKK